ncbi:hypothetical protein DMENIID0001_099900 [Sergentomyia squamirostris]
MSLFLGKELKSEVKMEDEALDQEEICRLCVQKVTQYSSIFRENLHESLTTLLGLSISIEDNWPKNICSQCRDTSRVCVEFIGIVREGEATLRNLFGELSDSALKPHIELIDVKETPEDEFLDSDNWIDANESNSSSDKGEEDSEDSKPLLRRRGRPRKIQQPEVIEPDAVIKQENTETTPGVKRRGRKRKVQSEESELSESSKKIRRITVAEEDENIRRFFKLQCHCCHEMFETLRKLSSHCHRKHQEDAVIICCDKKFNSRMKLVTHLNSHINPNAFKCEECDKNFNSERGLQVHNLNKHVPPEEHLFKCSKCPRSFMTQGRFKAHLVTHIPDTEKTFKCPQCSKAFARNSMLKQHVNHTHEELNKQVCEICAKVFTSKYTYKIHMSNHLGTDSKKFPCTLCDKVFKRKRLLTVHIDRHNNQGKIFKCDVCSKEAPNRSALQRHIQYSHLKVRKFQCNLCSSAFKTTIGLKEHIATHSSSQILYTCLFCPKQFNSNANKYVHQKRKHPDEYEVMQKGKK